MHKTQQKEGEKKVLSSGQTDHEEQNLLHTLKCLSSHFVHSLFRNDRFPQPLATLRFTFASFTIPGNGGPFDRTMSDRERKVFCEIGCGVTLPGTDKNPHFSVVLFVKISCWQGKQTPVRHLSSSAF